MSYNQRANRYSNSFELFFAEEILNGRSATIAQLKTVKAITDGEKHTVLIKARRTGISTVFCAYALWFTLFRSRSKLLCAPVLGPIIPNWNSIASKWNLKLKVEEIGPSVFWMRKPLSIYFQGYGNANLILDEVSYDKSSAKEQLSQFVRPVTNFSHHNFSISSTMLSPSLSKKDFEDAMRSIYGGTVKIIYLPWYEGNMTEEDYYLTTSNMNEEEIRSEFWCEFSQ